MRKLIIIIVGIIIPGFLVFLVIKGYNLLFEANVNEAVAPYTLFVDESTTIDDVYAQFVEDEVLNAPEGFLILANKKGLSAPKPGHYIIEAGQSSNGIVNTLMAGFQEPIRKGWKDRFVWRSWGGKNSDNYGVNKQYSQSSWRIFCFCRCW